MYPYRVEYNFDLALTKHYSDERLSNVG